MNIQTKVTTTLFMNGKETETLLYLLKLFVAYDESAAFKDSLRTTIRTFGDNMIKLMEGDTK